MNADRSKSDAASLKAVSRSESATLLPRSLWASFALLALLKLWLVGSQNLTAIAGAGHDDRLFLNLASALLRGEWLGPYNNLTLAKGPFYPMWIAVVCKAGIPLLLAEHLLYIAACALIIIAVRPVLSRPWMLFFAFAALLFNPVSYTSAVMTQVIREGIYPALTLVVFAGAAGLSTRYKSPPRALAPWSIGLGLGLSAFWLTREEGVWMIPSVLLLVGFTAVKLWRERLFTVKTAALLVLPFGIWIVSVVCVAGMNKMHYGVFAVSELKSPDFADAYRAILRVRHDHWKPTVPVPRDAREKIYRVSPAFLELEKFLEGDIGQSWASMFKSLRELVARNPEIEKKFSAFFDREPSGAWSEAFTDDSDMHGGWFIWAFRDAVQAAGYYASGETAARYYRRVAAEVNAACSDGRLACTGSRGLAFLPPWRGEYAYPLAKTVIHGALFLARFAELDVNPLPSMGDEESLRLFREVTHERLGPSQFQVSGWVVSRQPDVSVSVRTAKGFSLGKARMHLPSPDVSSYFRARGNDAPETRNARFEITGEAISRAGTYSERCALQVEGGNGPLARLPLDGSKTRIDTPELSLAVDVLGMKNGPSKSDKMRLAGLRGIGRAYHGAAPFVVGVGLILYLGGVGKILRIKIAPITHVIIGALLTAMVLRLTMLSAIHVSSFPAITVSYLAPCYPLLLVCIAMIFGSLLPQRAASLSGAPEKESEALHSSSVGLSARVCRSDEIGREE